MRVKLRVKKDFYNHTNSLRLLGGCPNLATARFDPSVAESFVTYDYAS
jgi:hypothetical protein